MGWYKRAAVIWSPIETEYLKRNRGEPVSQLSIALAKTRSAIMNKLREIDGKPCKKSSKTISRIGKRKDLGGIFMRSSWEANVARWIKNQGMTFDYEPKIFVFDGVKHGTVSYVPDFKSSDDTWIEVKGMLKKSDRTRIKRFKKHYGEEFKLLRAITGGPNTEATKFFTEMGVPVIAYYNELSQKYKNVIPGWEP